MDYFTLITPDIGFICLPFPESIINPILIEEKRRSCNQQVNPI